MKASDTFTITLTWCDKHKNWWVTNCPDCMVDANEESIKRAGIKEVVEWIKENLVDEDNLIPVGNTIYLRFRPPIDIKEWQSKLKEWGIHEGGNK